MAIERYRVTDRDSWLAMRRGDLTASDLAAAIGFDPYKTPLRVYAEKSGLILGEAESPIMRRGRWMEHAALAALREEYPQWEIEPPGVYLRDPEIRLGATPDAIAIAPDEPGLINCQLKTISKPVFQRDWADGPPLGYVLQTLAEGLLLDATRSILAALVVDTYSAELQPFDIPRHAQAEARIREIAANFWRDIAAGRAPKADYRRDSETIAEIYAAPQPGPPLDLAADNRLPEILAERERLRAEIEAGRESLEAIEAEIKEKLGPAETAVLPGWRISWKQQTRKAYAVAAATYRVLRVNRDNEEGEAA